MSGWWNWYDRTPGKQLSDMDVGLKVLYVATGTGILLCLLVAVGAC